MRFLPEVLQAAGVVAVVVAVFFLLPWANATLVGGLVALVVGVLLEIGRNPRRPRPSTAEKGGGN